MFSVSAVNWRSLNVSNSFVVVAVLVMALFRIANSIIYVSSLSDLSLLTIAILGALPYTVCAGRRQHLKS